MNQVVPGYRMASLYVGDLHEGVTEAMLFKKFSTVGTVLSVRICHDSITNRSLGYGYVNFQTYDDAARALDTMNSDIMKGRPIRIMWSQRDPSLRRSGLGNIFIKNLCKDIDNKALHDTFEVFGKISSCKISRNKSGESNGYGFVHYETEEAANQAIQRVNGMLIKGQKVYVGRFIPRRDREKAQNERVKNFTNIYVKNLSKDIDDHKLYSLFVKFGQIDSYKVILDDAGKSKGFGFVAFKTTEAAKSAVNKLNGQEYMGQKLFVGRAQTKDEREKELKQKFEERKKKRQEAYQGINLYIKNLDNTFDDEKLENEFKSFGTITSAKVMTDANGKSKGFGFVCFSSADEATKAIFKMNNKIIGTKPLYVCLAQRKEDRKSDLANKRNNIRMPPHSGPMFRPPLLVHQLPRYPMSQQFQQNQPTAPWTSQSNVRPSFNQGGCTVANSYPNFMAAPRAITGQQLADSVYSAYLRDPTNKSIGKDLKPTIEEQKQDIGEILYQKIASMHPTLAAKITGMIVDDTDLSRLCELAHNELELMELVNNAINVLKKYEAQSKSN